ncbi:hypothetical protein [Winogradskyella thalassocola]|uniref:Uncharacterized protein n=1 Tax=Winogradskyella thalassocola TaxID=262004 RepID=A0A1G8AT15_9FLAO|nr:hypothetical protein [Winogradskyella thalassocola]SDH24105.1 hypothetical protein SAMN04489796_1029 [Winogradskyella thalassocola]
MRTTNQPPNSKGVLKIITLIHLALCSSILLLGIVVLFITENARLNFADTEDLFFYVVPLFAIVAASASHLVFQKNLKQVHEKSSLKEKLVHYQTSKIIQFAMIEAPTFLGIVIFLITSNQFYLIVSALLLAYLVVLRPSASMMKENLNLNADQDRAFKESFR